MTQATAKTADLSRKDRMNSKERLAALVAGRPLDRVPFDPMSMGFSAKQYGIDRGEMYREPEKAFAAGLHLMGQYPWISFRPRYGWAARGGWEFGGTIRWPDGDSLPSPIAPDPVITRPEEVDQLPLPDPESAGMVPLVERFNRISRGHGFPASLVGGSPTTLSMGVAGTETLLRWMLKFPETVHKLQRKVTGFITRCAQITMDRYGAENCSLHFGVPSESNYLMSEKAFRTFCKPYIQEVLDFQVSRGLRRLVVHLCGDHRANLVHWADMPLPPRTVFSIGNEMDLETVGQLIGKDHILAGNISTSVLATGSPTDVVAEARRCLSAGMKHAGGFILMPACELPPDTPPENFAAVSDALYEYGYY